MGHVLEDIMLCNHCGSHNQNPNTNCTNCGAVNVQMNQNAVLPPLPTVRATWQQQPVNSAPCTTPGLTWGRVLAAIGIFLLSAVVITDLVLDWVHIKTGATTVELSSTEKNIVTKVDATEKVVVAKVDALDGKVDKLDKNVGTVLTAIANDVKTVNDNVETVNDNLTQVKQDLSNEIVQDGDKTREKIAEESRKVRWSIKRSERNFEAISDKLDRIEKIRPTVTVKIAK